MLIYPMSVSVDDFIADREGASSPAPDALRSVRRTAAATAWYGHAASPLDAGTR